MIQQKSNFDRIENMNDFYLDVIDQAVKTFIMSYYKSMLFIKRYNKNLLTVKDAIYESSILVYKIKNHTYILANNKEKLIKNLYNLLVTRIMNKLVDDGILELCWSNNDFLWRKKKKANISAWRKNHVK